MSDLYTIPTDGVYRTLDGKEAYQYKAGSVISMQMAIRMGLPGAGYPYVQPFGDAQIEGIAKLVGAPGSAVAQAVAPLGSWGPVVAGTGDSKMQGGSGQSVRSYASTYLQELAFESDGQLYNPYNFGHAGYTSAQLLPLFGTEIAPMKPDVVIEDMGTNDVNLVGDNTKGQLTIANIAALHAKSAGIGAAFVLMTQPPQGMAALPNPPDAPLYSVEPTGGTIGVSSPQYKILYIGTASTVTLPSPAATATVASGATNAVRVLCPWLDGMTGWDVYKSTDGGTTFLRLAQVRSTSDARLALSYLDTGSVTPAGVIPSSNTTAVAVNATTNAMLLAINSQKKRYAQQHGLEIIDVYGLVTDPLTGMYRQGYTPDGTHCTLKAQKEIGALIWSTIGQRFRKTIPYGSLSNVDPKNLLPGNQAGASNGLFLLSSGNIPTGISANGGSATGETKSVASRTGHRGNAFRVTRTTYDARPWAAFPYPAIVAGHVYVGMFTLELINGDAGGVAQIFYQWRAGGVANSTNFMLRLTTMTSRTPKRFMTMPIVAPAGVDAIAVRFDFIASYPSDAAISEVFLYDLTDMFGITSWPEAT